MEHCRARRQVLILDSCFSGAFAHGAKGEADLGLRDRFMGQGRGRVVLTASAATEYSFEGDPTDAAAPAGSVFTAALVQGLRTGEADTDHDGHVSVDDAYAYVFDQVQAVGAAQTPQKWLYGAEARILLARTPARSAIIPAPLPESLRAGLESPHPGIRIGVVTELGEWLTGGDPTRVATALRHLQEVAETDIPRVAATARILLGTRTTAEPSALAAAPASALVPPSDLARVSAEGTVAQLRSTIAQLEQQQTQAFDRGYAGVERSAEEALTASRAGLEEAEHTLAEFTQEDPHRRQVEQSRKAADNRTITTSSTPRTSATGTLASGETLAAPREKLSRGRVDPRPLARTLTGHDGVHEVAFSPDGRLLATAGHDGTVRLWDPAAGKQRCTLTGHFRGVHGVAFSPDGRLLATVGSGGTVRLWDPAAGEQRHILTGHDGRVSGVAFSPDGRLLATAGDGTVRLWE